MRIYYDEESDYLELRFGKSTKNYGEDIGNDITLFKDEETDEIIGIGILNFKEHTKDLEELEISLPVAVNFSTLKIKE